MVASIPRVRRLFVQTQDAMALVNELWSGAFVPTRLASRLGAGDQVLLGICDDGSTEPVTEMPVVVTGRTFDVRIGIGVFVKLDASEVLGDARVS